MEEITAVYETKKAIARAHGMPNMKLVEAACRSFYKVICKEGKEGLIRDVCVVYEQSDCRL